jgi:4'-phosphopantetheinyl transferase
VLWSAKESALKALRTGLREDTHSVEVESVDGDGSGWGPVRVRRIADSRIFNGWWRRRGGLVLSVVSCPMRDATTGKSGMEARPPLDLGLAIPRS